MGRPRKDSTPRGNAIAIKTEIGKTRKDSSSGCHAIELKGERLLSPEKGADAIMCGTLRRSVRLSKRDVVLNRASRASQRPALELIRESLPNSVQNNGSVPGPVRVPVPVPNNPVANAIEAEAEAPDHREKETPEMQSKIDYLVESVKEFMEKGVKIASQDTNSAREATYKSMYFESQRKIEELVEENRELSKKYDVSLAKFEMLQQINASMQNMNNVALVNNIGKAAEAMASLAAQGKAAAGEATTSASPEVQIVAVRGNNSVSLPVRRSTRRTGGV